MNLYKVVVQSTGYYYAVAESSESALKIVVQFARQYNRYFVPDVELVEFIASEGGGQPLIIQKEQQ